MTWEVFDGKQVKETLKASYDCSINNRTLYIRQHLLNRYDTMRVWLYYENESCEIGFTFAEPMDEGALKITGRQGAVSLSGFMNRFSLDESIYGEYQVVTEYGCRIYRLSRVESKDKPMTLGKYLFQAYQYNCDNCQGHGFMWREAAFTGGSGHTTAVCNRCQGWGIDPESKIDFENGLCTHGLEQDWNEHTDNRYEWTSIVRTE